MLDKTADFIFEVRSDGEIGRYTGDFSDYEANKTSEIKGNAAKPKGDKQQQPKQRKLKFSYNERMEYETSAQEVENLEKEIEKCNTDMAGCSSDYAKLNEIIEKKDALEQRLSEKMERWLYLEELAEKIAGGQQEQF